MRVRFEARTRRRINVNPGSVPVRIIEPHGCDSFSFARNVKRSAAYHGLSVYSRGDFDRARASRREPSELLSGDYAGGLTRGPNLMAAQAAAASAPMASASIWGQHRDTNLADMFATRAKSSPTRERARESAGLAVPALFGYAVSR